MNKQCEQIDVEVELFAGQKVINLFQKLAGWVFMGDGGLHYQPHRNEYKLSDPST